MKRCTGNRDRFLRENATWLAKEVYLSTLLEVPDTAPQGPNSSFSTSLTGERELE